MAANGQSHFEKILRSIIDGEEYTDEPVSVMEALLLELKEVIEAGGGGEGTTNYNALKNKPKIGGTELKGDMSFDDIGIQEEMDTITSAELAAMWD